MNDDEARVAAQDALDLLEELVRECSWYPSAIELNQYNGDELEVRATDILKRAGRDIPD